MLVIVSKVEDKFVEDEGCFFCFVCFEFVGWVDESKLKVVRYCYVEIIGIVD